ncbi:DNA methyltransferase [Aeromonas veronii]
MQQDSLFSSDSPQQDLVAGPVTCLGKTFANDQARRDYFLALLAEKLKDPEFRKIEGFPIGSDDDILNLSDPPYYTACPNPWIGDFIAEWEAKKPSSDEEYHREPFAADVSEGKNDPIYNAHSYHTKVPHKAIMRYILHYTNPGDIVFDGFCGTGMTGVAAQMCADKSLVESLFSSDSESSEYKYGLRHAIVNDLAPIATYIAYNYNTPINASFEKMCKSAIEMAKRECGWMYQTRHTDGNIGEICYTVWSDVFTCQNCQHEIIFYKSAIDPKHGVKDEFECESCGQVLNKSKLERVWSYNYDTMLKDNVKHAKQVPVLINYRVGKKRYDKTPDEHDLFIINKIDSLSIPYSYPINQMPDGFNTRQPKMSHGFTHVHHFYTKRNLCTLGFLWNLTRNPEFSRLKVLLTSTNIHLNKMRRWQPIKPGGTPGLPGTLYVCATPVELSVFDSLPRKLRDLNTSLINAKDNTPRGIISNSSMSCSSLLDNSVDYIFIDPPFGANINYSELNYMIESWLGVVTNNTHEAIENSYQGKDVNDYRKLMLRSFKEAYRILKPGRWITIEFSNTKATIWNSIQQALSDAGFIVANVSALDKKFGSFKAVTTPTAVKQDLVISAYKPSSGFEYRFNQEASSESGVWDFIQTHLGFLSKTKSQGAMLTAIPERDPRILFDQLVAYYVRKGYSLPIDSKQFQLGLAQRFVERDGMFFLPEQALEYDKKRLVYGELTQSSLFVKDETSAIDWLRQLLRNKPQTFADINPLYMQQLSGFSKHEVTLDLRELLSQNFLCYDGQDEVPDQIHSYLSSNWKELRNLAKNDPALVAKAKDRWYLPDPNKAGDLEKLREKSLLKEFEEYKVAKKKLKVFRIEAVRVGFKKLWEQQEFAALIAVAEKLPSNVLEEDPVLLMYFDQAVTLSQVDADDEW